MSKDKQIKEMAKDLCHSTMCDLETYNNCRMPQGNCGRCQRVAEDLYNAGYRKQSAGEWIDKPTGAYGRMQSWCSACGKHSGIGGIESNRHKPYCPNCGAKMKGGAE